MPTVVIADLNKINHHLLAEDEKIIESLDEITDSSYIYILDDSHFLDVGKIETDCLHVPFNKWNDTCRNTKVYFDLEQYSFFETFKNSLNTDPAVLRFYRKEEIAYSDKLILEDLLVFSGIFGKPVKLNISHTSSHLRPQHVIITVRFTNKVIAHFEYTFLTNKTNVDVEWSSKGKIIEFNSEKESAFETSSQSFKKNLYTIPSLISTSKIMEKELLELISLYSLDLKERISL